MLKDRNLKLTGNKSDLIERLEKDDFSKIPVYVPPVRSKFQMAGYEDIPDLLIICDSKDIISLGNLSSLEVKPSRIVLTLNDDVSSGPIYDQLIDFLLSYPYLTMLDIGACDPSGHNVGVDYGKEVIEILKHNNSLKALKLRVEYLNFEDLGQVLATQSSLRELYLTDYHSGDVIPIFNSLRTNTSLQLIEFNHNQRSHYDVEDIKDIIDSVAANSTLTSLNLNFLIPESYDVDPQLPTILEQLINHPSLTYLNLGPDFIFGTDIPIKYPEELLDENYSEELLEENYPEEEILLWKTIKRIEKQFKSPQ